MGSIEAKGGRCEGCRRVVDMDILSSASFSSSSSIFLYGRKVVFIESAQATSLEDGKKGKEDEQRYKNSVLLIVEIFKQN